MDHVSPAGGEGYEWGAKQTLHPRLPTFCSLPSIPSPQTHHPTKKKEHSLLVLPSVNTIINFATEFLECLQNYNPNIHIKCFRCFKCFGCFRCFISLLDHKTAPFWSKSEQTRQTDRVVPAPYHCYGKRPKRQSTHLWGRIPNLPSSPHLILSCKL